MKKLPKGNYFCVYCLFEKDKLVDLGPKRSEEEEDEYDYPYWCNECNSPDGYDTFDGLVKSLHEAKKQIDKHLKETIEMQKKYEEK